MNKARRKAIEYTISIMQKVSVDLDTIRDEEQEAFDNLPDSLQYSERGEQMEEYIDTLGDAVSDIDDIIGSLCEIIGL